MAEKKSQSEKQQLSDLFRAESFLLSGLCHPSGDAGRVTLFSGAETSSTVDTFAALDEVGRGCVAGPVVVCATLWRRAEFSKPFAVWLNSLRDSKKMSLTARNSAFESALSQAIIERQTAWDELPPENTSTEHPSISPYALKNPVHKQFWKAEKLAQALTTPAAAKKQVNHFALAHVGVGHASATEIDNHGIMAALGLAASRALSIISDYYNPSAILFDGNRPLTLSPQWAETPQVLVTKGDDLLKTISASSVLAKVIRDRWMEKYSAVYPDYGFEEHRGYGTAKHQNLLAKNGFSPIHRRSFLKNICPQHHH